MDKTQPIFQPFCWINDEETTRRFSNDDINLYRDVICGCRTVLDLLIYDRLGDDCEPSQPILGLNDRSHLELMVRSSLQLMENVIDRKFDSLRINDEIPTTH